LKSTYLASPKFLGWPRHCKLSFTEVFAEILSADLMLCKRTKTGLRACRLNCHAVNSKLAKTPHEIVHLIGRRAMSGYIFGRLILLGWLCLHHI